MKIRSVRIDRRRRCFLVRTARGEFEFPWAQLTVVPSPADPVASVAPDPELGREAFTYRLASGAVDSVHIDHVLRFVGDPEYRRKELLHALTLEAGKALPSSGRSKRSLARQLGTSIAQVLRLLDTADSRKSLDSMVRLLAALGRRVEVRVLAAENRGVPGSPSVSGAGTRADGVERTVRSRSPRRGLRSGEKDRP
ncbi:MAG: hypothetical protein HUU06_08465 [Planctomycetaceae bacterium]|nr:hypothetical protein [Planctomycetaceae bacterium]